MSTLDNHLVARTGVHAKGGGNDLCVGGKGQGVRVAIDAGLGGRWAVAGSF